MFDKFGEFDSYEELNAAAEKFLKDGDINNIIALAEENGIDQEDAQDYADGCIPELSTIFTAAYGRLEVQQRVDIESKKNYVEKMPLMVINTMLQGMCTSVEVAAAVMKKGKRIVEIYEAMKAEAIKYATAEVKKQMAADPTKKKIDVMEICCGTDRELCNIIRTYYMGSEKDFTKSISDLYKE